MEQPCIVWAEGITLAFAEEQILRSALHAHSFDIKATAKALGVCRATIYKKALEHFGRPVADLRRDFILTSVA